VKALDESLSLKASKVTVEQLQMVAMPQMAARVKEIKEL
jgi:hypothetical protein